MCMFEYPHQHCRHYQTTLPCCLSRLFILVSKVAYLLEVSYMKRSSCKISTFEKLLLPSSFKLDIRLYACATMRM